MSFTVNYPESIPPTFTEKEAAYILKKQMNEMNCVEINVYCIHWIPKYKATKT